MAVNFQAQRYSLRLVPCEKDGTIGDLTEEGICDNNKETLDYLSLGKGDPYQRFAVNAGILGSFTLCRKISLKFARAGFKEDAMKSKYTMTYKVDGADFGNVLS